MSGVGRYLSKPWTGVALVVVLTAAATTFVAVRIPDPEISPALAQRQPDPARGKYIAVLGDCRGCHTAPGGTPLAGGLPFATPVGIVYSTNITPDRNTGIGSYSFKDFARAMRLGVGPDGGRLYPAMPYTSFTKLSDEDLQDLFTYLQQDVASIDKAPPPSPIRWPLSMRWPLAFWDLAFLDEPRFVGDASKGPQWNRGAYLVEALEHCGECHTPRHATLNLDNSKKFAGTFVEGWKAYNITASQQSGLGGWSDDALVSYLSTGHADCHSSASGPMAEAIEASLRYVSADDIRAIVAYLRSIPAIDNEPAVAVNAPAAMGATPPSNLGARVFSGNCANCHDWDGKGVQSPYAALLGSRTVNDPDATNLKAIMVTGSNMPLPIEHAFMPTFAHGHSDDELAAVANFVNGYFGNGTANVSAADIDKQRGALSVGEAAFFDQSADQKAGASMIDLITAPYAALLLRWSLGIMFIANALLKWRVYTMPVTVENFRSIGLPGWLAYVVTAVELIGGGCLVLGLAPRLVALLLVPLIVGTIITVHGKNGWPFSNKGGGWEFPAFWAAMLLVQFLVGDGALTLVRSPSISSFIAALN
jgi:mono/diheme cytochrome c family protein/uncharacterized membrane protein YphA (DoxX/SURF4 family)